MSYSHAPLTILSDDEAAFRDAVAGFANDEVRPRVQQMEREGKIDRALIDKFFEMGLMGIEVAEAYGGAAGSLVMVAIGVEEISKVDPAAAIVLDVQNTLVNYPIRSLRQRPLKIDAICRDSHRRSLARTRSPSRQSGPTRSACRRAPRSAARAGCSTGARCGSRTAPKPRSTSSSRTRIRRPATRGSPRSSSSATSRASASARRKTSSASARRARPS